MGVRVFELGVSGNGARDSYQSCRAFGCEMYDYPPLKLFHDFMTEGSHVARWSIRALILVSILENKPSIFRSR